MAQGKSKGTIGFWRAMALSAAAAIALAAACAIGAPFAAQAESVAIPIASMHYGDDNYYPSQVAQINQELQRLKGKTVTIDMHRDWDARDTSADGVKIPEPLVIPSGSRVTLNMDGHMIDRDLSGEAADMSQKDGCVILVERGAVLVVNGGLDDDHEAYVYANTEVDGRKAPELKTFEGGLITGGNNKNSAGGIRILSGSTVTLNGVTIAGCRNEGADEAHSFGGGVRMEGGNTTLNLNNSTITGCFANTGGGIYVDATGKALINLTDSHVDGNFARYSGGGIAQAGPEVAIVADEASTISSNGSGEIGGGIYGGASKITVRGATLRNNTAVDGGGLYARGDATTLQGLTIEQNTATNRGGGVYLSAQGARGDYAGDSTIASCTVQANTAAAHGGIYIDEYINQSKSRKRTISGKTIIARNTASGGSVPNLCIGTDEWGHKRESFALTEDAEVWAGFEAQSGESISDDVKNSAVGDSRCEVFLHSEHAPLVFRFNLGTRVIELVEPGSTTATDIKLAAADINDASRAGKTSSARATTPGKFGTVGAGGAAGTDYDLIRGFYMHDNEDNAAVFYYSDGLFYADPETYNTHLATLSWAYTLAGGYLNQDKDPDANGNTYYNKHAAARQFLANIGCSDQTIYVNDFNTQKPSTDSIGVTIGSKELARAGGEKTGDILIPISVRGMGYEAEWVSNVTLGTAAEMGPGAEAKGFASAADKVFAEIEYYLKKYNLEDKFKDGKVKFWVTGFSRAGATANLTSKRLVDKIARECTGSQKSQVFGYTCEAPKGGTDLAEVSGNRYFCIHNMLNKVDLIPYVAPGQMGFKRYGVDHYIPGTDAGTPKASTASVSGGGANGPTTVTTYTDNEPTWTKTEAYNTRKAQMLKHLSAMDDNMVFDDYFQPKALDFLQYSFPASLNYMVMYNSGDYDGNRAEYFVADFVRFFQEGPQLEENPWKGRAVRSRDAYAGNPYTLDGKTYSTIQAAIQNLVKSLMGSEGGGKSSFLNKAGNIKDQIPIVDLSFSNYSFSMASLYTEVIGEWYELPTSVQVFWINKLLDALKKSGALDGLSADDLTKFEAMFPTLVNMAFNFVDGDFNYKPGKADDGSLSKGWANGSSDSMMFTATFATNASYILSCHQPMVNISWARTYDSWFTDNGELDLYSLSGPSSVAAPNAYKTAGGEMLALDGGGQVTDKNRMVGNQRIVLDNAAIVGEAIYYDLIDETVGKTLASNQIYRGGIDLALDGARGKTFLIRTYDISYGAKSDVASYRVYLFDANHTVIVKDLAANTPISLGGQAADAADEGAGTGAAARLGTHGMTLVANADPAKLQAQDADGANEDFGEYRTKTFSFAEGQEALVQAECPDALYFKEWHVEAQYGDGINVDGASDYASLVFSPADLKRNAAASFTMPASDAEPDKTPVFPAEYQLEFTAQYGRRITAVSTELAAPREGSALPTSMVVAFSNGKTATYPVSWSYKEGDRMVPVSSEAGNEHKAYKETEYTATATIPQDTAADVAFAASVSVNAQAGTAQTPALRSNADGSITIEIAYDATGTAEGDYRESATMHFGVEALDLNTGARMPDVPVVQYSALPEQAVQITAPDVQDAQFAGWDLSGSGIEYSGDESALEQKTISLAMPHSGGLAENATISALYVPVAKKVEVNLRDQDGELFAPSENDARFDHAELFITTAKEYQIHPNNLEVVWNPALPDDGSFAYMTDYLASVIIVPDDEGWVRAKPRGADDSAYEQVNLIIAPAENIEVAFNGSSDDLMFDDETLTASKVFPKMTYTLDAVKKPADIDGVPYGTGEGAIRGLLPATTKVLATNGFELDADIEWKSLAVTEGAGDELASKVWTATGTVNPPESFTNKNGVSLDVSLAVRVEGSAAVDEVALSPSATLASGTYLFDQVTTLVTNEPGGTTYYTLDGSDPSDPGNAERAAYDGEDIFVSRLTASVAEGAEDASRKALTVKACTEAAGKLTSPVAEYRYEFADVPMPTAADYEFDGTEHIGIEGSPLYTLVLEEDSDARIDEYGNAVATLPGTYQVTAVLSYGDDWWAGSDDSATPRTQENQVLTFTISGETPSEDVICDVAVSANPTEGGIVTGAGAYVKGQTVMATALPERGYDFVNWTLDGTEVSTDARYEFNVEDDCELVANFAVQTFTISFVDEDGTVLQSGRVPYGVTPDYTGATPTKAADAQHTYTFAGWDAEIAPATGDATYKATYKSAAREYTVKFVNEDDTVLQSGKVAYGEMPAYAGKAPTKAATAKYTYTFSGWTPAIAKVAGDATYKATYKATAKDDGKGSDGTDLGPGADAKNADAAIKGMTSDDDPAGTNFAKLKLKVAKTGKKTIKLAWSKVKGAKKYVLYGNRCGTKHKMKKLKTLKSTARALKVTKAPKKLVAGKMYKFVLVALDKNNKVLSTSKVVHACTAGGKYGNPKSVSVTKKVANKAKAMKKGKTLKLGAKVVMPAGKKLRKHVNIRYESTKKKVATVTKKGVVKARAKGSCYIYAYAQNGVCKRILVKVK